ncbi:hypothetical protein O181_083227 [Austropuccinia psidii MF-1]|uniref:Uncharacterized protein n=1 Tax=Austropuccinia psidii MF-1 TaxID=1389203 RepID=A0A9Q3FU09_9BASI|nr:hypothetical protein [Austropuccinia psidii MF-1]
MWTRKRQDQIQKCQFFLKKDTFGGCQSCPQFPKVCTTDFDVSSDPELIHDNIFRAEPFSSGSNRKISMPIKKLVQSSQRRGVGNMPKPLEWGHELLLTHQGLSGSGEEHRTLRGWSPLSCKDKVKKIKNWLKNQSPLSINQKKELEMTPALETEAPVVSTSSKPAPEVPKDKATGPQQKQRGPKNHQGKGNCHRTYPQGYTIPKLEPSAGDSVFNIARTLMEFTAKEKERMNRNFPCK